jgi:hypothetical protein
LLNPDPDPHTDLDLNATLLIGKKIAFKKDDLHVDFTKFSRMGRFTLGTWIQIFLKKLRPYPDPPEMKAGPQSLFNTLPAF